MKKRKIYTENNLVKLLYAQDDDRRLIYDMAFEEASIWQAMIKEKEDFDWALIGEEEPHFFGADPGKSKYLLIEYREEIIGTISHTYHDGKIKSMELDIWLRSEKYTSKGLGSSAMKLLIHTLAEHYSIETFLIRPWRRNIRAVKAYEKCGFREKSDFDAADYYSKYLAEHGDGDFGKEETVNMVLDIHK